jgi:hypothetical protein
VARTETVVVEVTDDLDGSAAAETISFAIDGKSFEIDLSKRNAAALRRALRPYAEAGREARRRGRPAKAASSGRRGRGGAKTLFSTLSDEEKASFRTWAVRRKLTTRSARRIADSAVQAWTDAGRP